MRGDSPGLEFLETPQGTTVRCGDRWLYSARAPRTGPERLSETFIPQEKCIILCLSPLLGYGLEGILAKLPETSCLVCLEADPRLYEVTAQSLAPLLAAHPRLRFAPLADLYRELSQISSLRNYRRVQSVSLSGGADLRRSEYRDFELSLMAALSTHWRNQATYQYLGRRWTRNLLTNLGELSRALPLKGLSAAVGDRDIFVCGAGPSLTASLDFIRDKREGLFLLCVDTAASALAAAGVRPDAILCLEAQVHNLPDFIGLSRSGIPLIADLTAHPVSFRGLGGPVYAVQSDFAPLGIMDRLEQAGLSPERIPPLGSVGVAAIHVAARIAANGGGCQRLYISGLDFSYPRGLVHCRGAASHLRRINSGKRLAADSLLAASFRPGVRAVKDRLGQECLSDPVMLEYAGLARSELAELSALNLSVIDLREGGIDLGVAESEAPQAHLVPQGPQAPQALQATQATTAPEAPPPDLTLRQKPSAAALRAFLEDELSRLRELSAILSGERSDADTGMRLKGLISQQDYLYLHFLPTSPDPSQDLSFLRRLSNESRAAQARTERALSRLE
jgi:hypothetical protein